MNYFKAPLLLYLLLALIDSVQAISQVTRSGKYLYTQPDGNRFYMKGIAYQPPGVIVTSADNPFKEPSTFIDPLDDESTCKRDVPFLEQLGVNVIRVYSVDSSRDHSGCMTLFSQAGIYVIIDLALPLNGSIDRYSPSWSTNLLDQYIATIDAFDKYDNVLAYNVGNEVIIQNTTSVAPFVKAAARDTKEYLQTINSSTLVGYAAIDGDASSFVLPVAQFLSCDPSNTNSGATSIDLYGLNNYQWCGNSNFQAAYSEITNDFSPYNVVAYFSEFGCITSLPRVWTEVSVLFGPQMASVWSGGVAFSYFPAQSAQGQFGMVTISANGANVTTSPDFTALQAQYSSVSPVNSSLQSQAAYPSCTSAAELNISTTLPPTPNEAACNCLEKSLSCQFTPTTNNYSVIVGVLLNDACSFLGAAGGSCDDIADNSSTGVYSPITGCDPRIILSYVMSKYYEMKSNNPQSCDFAGNATINGHSSASATAAASSCIANPSATSTPTTVGAASNTRNGSVSLAGSLDMTVRMGVMAMIGVVGAVWTLV